MLEFLITVKTQLICLIALLYIGYLYIREGKHLDKISEKSHCNKYFDMMIICADASVLFDGITAYTAIHHNTVSPWLNGNLHFLFYISLMIFSACYLEYWLSITGMLPENTIKRIALWLPCIIAMYFGGLNMRTLRYIDGKYTSYSMGFAVYVCFGAVALYLLTTLILVLTNIRKVKRNKRSSLVACSAFAVTCLMIQLFFPEMLISCFATTLIILTLYLGMENPTVKMVEVYHQEMLMGFTTLLEKKDDGTGGHIRRTSKYAVIIAKELKKDPKYKNHITRDYINSLEQAAPMHDIGKISIPDSILQKPGKLTDEEFATMKTHSAEGAKIIKETFEHVVENEEESMAYKVALNHHEKWNGRGYPSGKKGEEIPLCARIMAVADVFDAVSAKRCYRDAMPLQKCYAIIYEGKGTDFDPEVVDAFFRRKIDIDKVYYSYREGA